MSKEFVSLKLRALKAGGWVVGSFGVLQMIRLGSNLILTRLLFPEAFGLMAIVYVLMTGMVLFSDLGVNQSIIQNKRGDDPSFMNTAWSVNILRGIMILLVIQIVAYNLPQIVDMGWIPTGSVYADPLLPAILAVFSVTSLLQGLESTKISLARRKVHLKQISIIELVSQIASLIVMVMWAWLYHNVWTLVAGSIVSGIVRCLMSHYYLSGPSNKLQWNPDYFKEIFHFGKWIFLLSIIGFMSINGDRLILGGLLEPLVLGLYAIATLLISSVQMLFNKVVSDVVFPAFSEVDKSSPEKVSTVHARFQLVADLFLFSSAGFLFASGNGIINILYDDRYVPAGSILSLLGLSLIGARHGIVERLWLATVTMRPLFFSHTLRLIVLFSGIPAGYGLAGLNGALLAIVVSFYAGWPVALYYRLRHDLVDWKFEFIGVPVFIVVVLISQAIL